MACNCDPSRKRDDECPCRDAPPLPGGSPQRALNPKVCPRGLKCGTGIPEKVPPTVRETSGTYRHIPRIPREPAEAPSRLDDDSFRSCISLETPRRAPCARPIGQNPPKPTCPASTAEPPPKLPPCTKTAEAQEKKPLLKRKTSTKRDSCHASEVASLPCGGIPETDQDAGRYDRISALEKTVSRTEWYDEEGYHSASISLSHLYRPDDVVGRPCSSDKRRNYLKAKLKELLAEMSLIPESVLAGNVEARPEPEVVAAALFMLEKEGSDLGALRPDSVFNKLFSQSSPERSIAIASAVPEANNDTVVPIVVDGGHRSNQLVDVPNANAIMENTRSVMAPNPNVYLQSERQETTRDGARAGRQGNATASVAEAFEYVMDAGPPAYRNCIRLNGSAKPCWFPGYSYACSEFVRTTADPGEALYESWRLCRPEHFHESVRSLVNAE